MITKQGWHIFFNGCIGIVLIASALWYFYHPNGLKRFKDRIEITHSLEKKLAHIQQKLLLEQSRHDRWNKSIEMKVNTTKNLYDVLAPDEILFYFK